MLGLLTSIGLEVTVILLLCCKRACEGTEPPQNKAQPRGREKLSGDATMPTFYPAKSKSMLIPDFSET